MDVLEKFSTHGRRALRDAFLDCRERGKPTVDLEHLLCGIARQRGSIGAELLAKMNVESETPAGALGQPRLTSPAAGLPRLSLNCRRSIEKATLLSSQFGHRYVGTEHLLAGILAQADPQLDAFLKHHSLSRQSLNDRLALVFKSTSKFPDLADALDSGHHREEDAALTATRPGKSAPSALENYATDLTAGPAQSRIDPLVGRAAEVERVIHILCRRTKNNPLLLGDPGVGKTAIVEGLAARIAQGAVPDVLRHRHIWQLDLALLVAGSSYRGEFEQRLKQLIAEIKHRPEVILFIDELHAIVGAGSATGSMDAANLMKPSLARGEIRCIGATTLEDYKRHLEHDAALDRRFQPVIVRQPEVPQTIAILKGLRPNYERYHGVTITDDAIAAAAVLSDRYLADRFQPDKAIDVLDEAAAATHLNRGSAGGSRLRGMEADLRRTTEGKRQAVSQERFEDALHLRETELKLQRQIAAIHRRLEQRAPAKRTLVTGREVAQVVARMTGMQVELLAASERQQLQRLEQVMSRRVLGQAGAVRRVAEVMRRAKAGIAPVRRPLGSFLFLGPSGVGKTELAKTLAATLFGGPDGLVRIDMSEFTESFTVSRLIGSPAGYVGYRDRAQLTDLVRKRPHCVVLFDEVEKAHPQVLTLLLQILDEGTLTDATGKSTNFRQAVVIMTSNVGTEQFTDQSKIGFDDRAPDLSVRLAETEREVVAKLGEQFPTELLNRIDQTVVFQPLDRTTVARIADLQLQELGKRLAEQRVSLAWSPAVCRAIAADSFSPEEGARAVQRTIQQQVETPVAELILHKARPKQITVSVKRGKLTIIRIGAKL